MKTGELEDEKRKHFGEEAEVGVRREKEVFAGCMQAP
jgi:hypothetical protein